MYIPNTLWTRLFFGIVFGQLVVCVALETYIFVAFETHIIIAPTGEDRGHASTATIPTYLAIFIFGFLYQLLLTWDALRLKNTIQVIGLCLYNAGMLIYSSVEISQIRSAVVNNSEFQQAVWADLDPPLIATPCVIALGTVLLSVVAWKLYGEFAWSIYKHISADLRLKRRYLQYQIYIALLKFDFFFFLAFTVQFLVVTHNGVSVAETAVTIAAIPVSIVLLLLAAYFTRRESFAGQTGVIALAGAAMAYFIFKLIRMYEPSQAYKYTPIRHSLTTFAILAIVLLVVTIIAAILCLRNFNKGLKPHVQNLKPTSTDEVGKYPAYGRPSPAADYSGHVHPLGQVQNRMTID